MKCAGKTCQFHRTTPESAMTLVEMMVAAGVSILMLTGIVIVFANSTRSFAVMGNYMDLDRTSRRALDQMSRDIRKSKDLISFSTNQLVFKYAGTTNLVYKYDSSSRVLTSWKTGDAKTNNLLTQCDNLAFTMYKNIPLSGGVFSTTTVPSEGKSISISWKCSRTVLGKKLTSEDSQQAVIVIRNKPVS